MLGKSNTGQSLPAPLENLRGETHGDKCLAPILSLTLLNHRTFSFTQRETQAGFQLLFIAFHTAHSLQSSEQADHSANIKDNH